MLEAFVTCSWSSVFVEALSCSLLETLGRFYSLFASCFRTNLLISVGGGDCQTNDGTNSTRFMPAFPASCPYVTAVGGTTGVPEVAVDFSGGGFSNYWPAPDYQTEAVASYLEATDPSYGDLFKYVFSKSL